MWSKVKVRLSLFAAVNTCIVPKNTGTCMHVCMSDINFVCKCTCSCNIGTLHTIGATKTACQFLFNILLRDTMQGHYFLLNILTGK